MMTRARLVVRSDKQDIADVELYRLGEHGERAVEGQDGEDGGSFASDEDEDDDGEDGEDDSDFDKGDSSLIGDFQPGEEKVLLRKLDWRVVGVVALLYLLSFLDRSSKSLLCAWRLSGSCGGWV